MASAVNRTPQFRRDHLMPDKGVVVYRAGEDIQLLHSTFYGAWNSLS